MQTPDYPIPLGFVHAATVRAWCGRIDFATREDPAELLVRPAGYVGPALVRADLVFAEAFGRTHIEGWDYIVNAEAVRFLNPINLIWLRRVHRLPNLRRFVLTTPSRLLRALGYTLRWIVRQDLIVASMDEAISPNGSAPSRPPGSANSAQQRTQRLK